MKRVVNIVLSVLIGDKFFDMRGRAGLLEFWTVMLVYVLLPLGVMAFVQKSPVIIICSFFLAFLSPWILWGLMVRRLHDLNLRGWWMLLILPLVLLPFWPGKKEPNRFDE